MKVVIQNRPNALTQRGGDTIVMERLADGLRALGVEVYIDLSADLDPTGFDLAHLINFATPDFTERLARRAHEACVPYVVTALYEDWPTFFNQSQIYALALQHYLDGGQNPDHWPKLSEAAATVEVHPRLENTWTAQHAALILATGKNEADLVVRDYGAVPTAIHHLGCDLSEAAASAQSFRERYNVGEFVLCVGRLERRKNQLMLLKALEQSDATVVFATGGFTYQPDYEANCRRFKRKGRTLFLGRLEASVLGSAFAAATVHALPSWYELPGLVSIEAARAGSNVVVTDYGTARDYLGSAAFYVRPDEPEDICNGVLAALHSPSRTRSSNGLPNRWVEDFTWKRTSAEVLEGYRRVLG